jgi:membrane-associated protease RseP (regulator of RpoE activity)
MFFDRKNVKRHYILFYRRTKRGIEYIDRIANAAPRFWNAYGWGGVAAAALAIPVSLATIVYTFYVTLFQQATDQGPSLIAPGIGASPDIQAGVSFIPAEWWFFGIAVLMVCHELSHGITARIEGFEINSVGWIVLGIIPGAFVEPKGENMLPGDEANRDDSRGMWEQGDWKSRIKVLAAGSWANFLVGIGFALLAVGMAQGVTVPEATGYVGILVGANNGSVEFQAQQGFPAYESGMRNGTLVSLNGMPVETPEDVTNFSDRLEPGDQVTIETTEGTFRMNATEQTLRQIRPSLEEYEGGLRWLEQGLWIVVMLNVLIGLFNMAPIKPLDGGLIVETLVKRFGSEEWLPYLDRISGVTFLGLILLMIVSAFGGI